MAENKTKETSESVAGFIETIEDGVQRADAKVITAIMERLSGEPAKMWGPSIIGFGHYHYKYESGREGDSVRIGFSPRKGQHAFYLGIFPTRETILARLGKYKTAKSCLYIKKLSDVDLEALEQLVQASLDHMDEKYPR